MKKTTAFIIAVISLFTLVYMKTNYYNLNRVDFFFQTWDAILWSTIGLWVGIYEVVKDKE